MTRAEAAAAQRARYHARKAAHLCVRCGAGLQDEDRPRCVECDAMVAGYQPSEAAQQRRRERAAARARAAYLANPEIERARIRERYAARKERGICVMCHRHAAADSNLCEGHRESERRRNREAARRRRAREARAA